MTKERRGRKESWAAIPLISPPSRPLRVQAFGTFSSAGARVWGRGSTFSHRHLLLLSFCLHLSPSSLFCLFSSLCIVLALFLIFFCISITYLSFCSSCPFQLSFYLLFAFLSLLCLSLSCLFNFVAASNLYVSVLCFLLLSTCSLLLCLCFMSFFRRHCILFLSSVVIIEHLISSAPTRPFLAL